MSDVLLVADDGPVRILTLNRPHVLNAIDGELGTALHDAFVAFDADPAARCLILTGAGERAFSSGGDLKSMADTDGPDMGGSARVITDALRYRPAKPVVAAVNGLAYGGGLELVLACDLAVCAEHATFALPEVRHGVLATGGGLVRLPRLVGVRRALELILTGKTIDAATALSWGMVNEIAPSGRELEVALDLARTIGANAPLSVELGKRTALAAVTATEHDIWRINAAAHAEIRRSPDALEGPRAFAEGRLPVWTGLRAP